MPTQSTQDHGCATQTQFPTAWLRKTDDPALRVRAAGAAPPQRSSIRGCATVDHHIGAPMRWLDESVNLHVARALSLALDALAQSCGGMGHVGNARPVANSHGHLSNEARHPLEWKFGLLINLFSVVAPDTSPSSGLGTLICDVRPPPSACCGLSTFGPLTLTHVAHSINEVKSLGTRLNSSSLVQMSGHTSAWGLALEQHHVRPCVYPLMILPMRMHTINKQKRTTLGIVPKASFSAPAHHKVNTAPPDIERHCSPSSAHCDFALP